MAGLRDSWCGGVERIADAQGIADTFCIRFIVAFANGFVELFAKCADLRALCVDDGELEAAMAGLTTRYDFVAACHGAVTLYVAV